MSDGAGTGAFADLRVIEVGGLEGLYAGKLLADQGAEVILVEPPDGHASRWLPPYAPDVIDETASVPFAYYNGNKRSVCLPLDTPDGRDSLAGLTTGADVVLAAGRPVDLRALGIEPGVLTRESGRLVVATVTPFGWEGPRADWVADDLVLQALGGMMNLGGYHDGRPLRPPELQSGISAGVFAAAGIAAAVLCRDTAGHGQHVDVSVQESVVMGLENSIQFYDMEDRVRTRHGGARVQVGRGVFESADGYVYLMLGMHAGSRFWPLFLRWLETEQVAGREALSGGHWSRREYIESEEAKAVFNDVFTSFTRTRTKQELYRSAQAHGVPLAPVNTIADVRLDRHLTARGFFVPVARAQWGHGPAEAPGAPYRMTGTPWQGRYAPPGLGADTERVLREGRTHPAPAGDAGRSHPALTGGSHGGPLAGVRVVDLSWVGAGPYCTRILADLGADVVKVESGTRVDQIRLSPPFRDGIAGVNRSGYFADRNAGKRSMCLDLKSLAGKELALTLIADADVVVNSFAPGTMDRLGLGYDAVRERAPRAVYLEMSMQGADGPHRGDIGYGLTIAAGAGLHHLVGEPGRPPCGTGTNYPDHIPSPVHAAFAVIAALRHRRATGLGQRVEVSQTEATVAALGPAVIADSLGLDVGPQDNVRADAVVHDAFRTRDPDTWIAISIYGPAELARLREVLGLAVGADATWAASVRGADRDLLRRWIEAGTCRAGGTELMSRLQAAGLRAGVVQTARELLEEDPQLRFRGHWLRLPHAEMGECLYNAMPIRLSAATVEPAYGAPMLGEHTTEVLTQQGHSAAEITRLRDDEVLK